jgi:hypothetical protein
MSILVELTLLFLLICLGFSAYYIYREKHINKTKMSFKESLDLTGIPVVTFYQGNNKFNFILDSGASTSCINEKFLNDITYETTDQKAYVWGMEGNKIRADFVYINLYYKNQNFVTKMLVTDLEAAFTSVKKDTGVTITGILGSDFLSKYKYVMDFKDNIAYIK